MAHGRFDGKRLRKVAQGSSFQDDREPRLRIGDIVRMNSGGPIMLVVDLNGPRVTTAWRARSGTVYEQKIPSICVHRVRDAW